MCNERQGIHMKKQITILLVLLLFVTLTLPVYAHSGRTDSNGGHHVTATGEYHYHHGYPAHQHPNGICPYANVTPSANFNDTNSDTSNSYAASTDKTEIIIASQSENGDSSDFDFIFIGAIVAIYILYRLICHAKQRREEQRRRSEEQKRKEQERIKYAELYDGIPTEDLVKIPNGVCIGDDGLPREISSNDHWGKIFTVYTTAAGRAFHGIKGCSGATYPINVCDTHGRQPCKRCNPQIPDTEWYREYKRIESIKVKYGFK